MNGVTLAGSAQLLEQLMEAAILAPSPDNNQPWKFHAHGDDLLICADWQRGLPSDVGDMFMYLSLGAAAENASIAASAQRVDTAVHFLSQQETEVAGCHGHAAKLVIGGTCEPDGLYEHLGDRTTCRRNYTKRSVEPQVLEAMSAAATRQDGVEVEWIADRNAVRELAGVVARCDLIRLQYRPFHDELYKQLRFTQEDAERTRDGLDVRTLELPPGTPSLLRSLRSWKRMQLLHRSGLGRLLAIPSRITVQASGALGFFTVPESTAEWFFRGGRALQRLWLTATSQQVSLQPIGSVPIFLRHLEHRQTGTLTPAMYQQIESQRTRLEARVKSVRGRVLEMIVRVGYSAPPSMRSLRRPLADFI